MHIYSECKGITKCMFQVLAEAPVLNSFIVNKRNDAAQLLELLFDSCEGIKKLMLRFCGLGEDSTGLLANIVTFYPDLEELVLEGCAPLTFTGYSLIPRLKKLCSLNISYCKVCNVNAHFIEIDVILQK